VKDDLICACLIYIHQSRADDSRVSEVSDPEMECGFWVVLGGFAFTLPPYLYVYTCTMIVYCIACLTIIISCYVISRKVRIEVVLGWAGRDCGCTDTVGYVCA
jgi:hypothetical protein